MSASNPHEFESDDRACEITRRFNARFALEEAIFDLRLQAEDLKALDGRVLFEGWRYDSDFLAYAGRLVVNRSTYLQIATNYVPRYSPDFVAVSDTIVSDTDTKTVFSVVRLDSGRYFPASPDLPPLIWRDQGGVLQLYGNQNPQPPTGKVFVTESIDDLQFKRERVDELSDLLRTIALDDGHQFQPYSGQ